MAKKKDKKMEEYLDRAAEAEIYGDPMEQEEIDPVGCLIMLGIFILIVWVVGAVFYEIVKFATTIL